MKQREMKQREEREMEAHRWRLECIQTSNFVDFVEMCTKSDDPELAQTLDCLRSLPGVGRKITALLNAASIHTTSDLVALYKEMAASQGIMEEQLDVCDPTQFTEHLQRHGLDLRTADKLTNWVHIVAILTGDRDKKQGNERREENERREGLTK